jgi:hypothetical protein
VRKLISSAARRFRLSTTALAFLCGLLVAGGTAAATGLINSSDVKNNSLTGRDIRNHSLTKVDFKGIMFSGPTGMTGPTGTRGVTGATGPTGPTGPGTVDGADVEMGRVNNPGASPISDCYAGAPSGLTATAVACGSSDVLGVAPPDSVAQSLRVVLDSPAPAGGLRFSVTSDSSDAISCDLPEGFIICDGAGPSANLGGSRLGVQLQDLALPHTPLPGASFVYELGPAP